MNKEDKELLLKDLCARLPYKPLCLCEWKQIAPNGSTGYVSELSTFLIEQFEGFEEFDDIPIKSVKPYLRLMSSMTDKEVDEYNDLCFCNTPYPGIAEEAVANFMDWLLKNHFDFRGLIPKGLAIEVTEKIIHTNKYEYRR